MRDLILDILTLFLLTTASLFVVIATVCLLIGIVNLVILNFITSLQFGLIAVGAYFISMFLGALILVLEVF